jgi:hypothetical protein
MSFNNHVDQFLPDFDPLPPRGDNCGQFLTFYMIPTFCHTTKCGLYADKTSSFPAHDTPLNLTWATSMNMLLYGVKFNGEINIVQFIFTRCVVYSFEQKLSLHKKVEK